MLTSCRVACIATQTFSRKAGSASIARTSAGGASYVIWCENFIGGWLLAAGGRMGRHHVVPRPGVATLPV